MADFCKKCSEQHFGKDFGDFKGIAEPGHVLFDICEGCGPGQFDHNGARVETHVITEKEQEAIDRLIDNQLEDERLVDL